MFENIMVFYRHWGLCISEHQYLQCFTTVRLSIVMFCVTD